jgi:hypothetical protein
MYGIRCIKGTGDTPATGYIDHNLLSHLGYLEKGNPCYVLASISFTKTINDSYQGIPELETKLRIQE